MIDLSRYTGICLLALTVIGWLSCTQQRQPCLTPKIATLSIETIHFPTDTSTTPVDTAIPAATFIPVVPGKDTQLVTTYPQQATFTLSLSPDSTICQWIFTTDSIQYVHLYHSDTLTFYYQRNLQFLSNACGYTYFYTLDSVHHATSSPSYPIIDSIHIINTSVTNNVNTKHLQIYIHPDF